jgi:hypothetical protein
MAKVRVTYDEHRRWGYPKNRDNRPYTEIEIVGPAGSERIWVLIDSGADTIQIDNAIAGRIGLIPANGTQVTFTSASGVSSTLTEHSNVEMTIEGRTIYDDCLFGPANVAVLGRETFLAAMDVGFDLRGWLFK